MNKSADQGAGGGSLIGRPTESGLVAASIMGMFKRTEVRM